MKYMLIIILILLSLITIYLIYISYIESHEEKFTVNKTVYISDNIDNLNDRNIISNATNTETVGTEKM